MEVLEYQYLNHIQSPDDVKKLQPCEIGPLCEEIRNCLIHTVAQNGGHLASNLGAVELTVALHRVFSSPQDAIIFDVGHQSYTHKLLTGRFEAFDSLRKKDGLSGFMRPQESAYDPFVTGHSSNSVSAAYGLFISKRLQDENSTAVAVIGDGALTGGLALEGLNNAGAGKGNFIVVLNDNKMSISKNVGGLARNLTRIRSKAGYHVFKNRLNRFLRCIPLIGEPLRRRLFASKLLLKNALYHSNIFEALGFHYYGPVDGHDEAAVENLLRIAKNQNHPALVHVVTVKGKGYPFAENQPNLYHGVGAFDEEMGITLKTGLDYSAVLGQTLCELAGEDQRVCAVTAAMTGGTGLTEFSKTYKDRFFDVGIAEEHAVTFAAGLAAGGMKPYFVVYSSFLQRAFDQVIHDAAIAGLPLHLCVDRAGIVGEDGVTHQGLFDVAFLSMIPGVSVFAPASFAELRGMIKQLNDRPGVTAIRYPRGGEEEGNLFAYTGLDVDWFCPGGERLAVTYGRLTGRVIAAAKAVGNTTVLKLNRLTDPDEDLLAKIVKYHEVFFFEEGIRQGGIGEKMGKKLLEAGYSHPYTHKAIDGFVSCMSVEEALAHYGLDTVGIKATLGG